MGKKLIKKKWSRMRENGVQNMMVKEVGKMVKKWSNESLKN